MKYLLVGFLTAMYAACGSVQDVGKTVIGGKINGAADQWVTFQNNSTKGNVDSTKVASDGSFAIQSKNMPLDFYKLTVGDQSMILVMDSTQQVVVQGDYSDLRGTYTVQGSKDSQLLAELAKKEQAFRTEKKALDASFKAIGPSATAQQKEKFQEDSKNLVEPFYNYLTNFITSNPKSPACITASHNLHPVQEMERYKTIKENLKDVIPMSNAYLSLKKKIADAERQAQQAKASQMAAKASGVGNEAPEISLEDPNGEIKPLSSFRGKYVLVDFWASWCGPCRRENPNVVKLYEKYKNDGFEVYGVSLDSSKDRWLKAIADDRLSWTHVSDLNKWNSIAAKAYGVRSIPHTVLLDKEGKIMNVKLRGAALEAKLKEIFGH